MERTEFKKVEELVNDFIQGMGESFETKHIAFLKQVIEITKLTQEEKQKLIDKLEKQNPLK